MEDQAKVSRGKSLKNVSKKKETTTHLMLLVRERLTQVVASKTKRKGRVQRTCRTASGLGVYTERPSACVKGAMEGFKAEQRLCLI